MSHKKGKDVEGNTKVFVYIFVYIYLEKAQQMD